MKVDFTQKMIFSFEGPNICLLGTPDDFKNLAKATIDLTSPNASRTINVTAFDFVNIAGDPVTLTFSSSPGADLLGKVTGEKDVLFHLDSRYWERIFIFFALMSWDKKTYYLNSFEDALKDLPLDQQCHFICSSEW